MNIHNRSKKEVSAVFATDDSLGPYGTRNTEVAMCRVRNISMPETV
jgi:hypothetical protein